MSDITGQAPAVSDDMVKAGAEAILRYMGEWGTDDDSTEAKAHELSQWVLDATLAGRTVVDRPVLAEIDAERSRQDARWGEQNHPDLYPPEDHGLVQQHYANEADGWKWLNADRVAEQNELGTPSDRNAAWDGVLLEEVYEALAEANPAQRRIELIQVAAVATAWVEAIDRRLASESSGDSARESLVARIARFGSSGHIKIGSPEGPRIVEDTRPRCLAEGSTDMHDGPHVCVRHAGHSEPPEDEHLCGCGADWLRGNE